MELKRTKLDLSTDTLFGRSVRYFTRHGTLANLVLALMLCLGLVSITKIRAQFFPDVVLESVIVEARWKGAGPTDIDESIVSALEPGLIALDAVESIDSVSREGIARISISFEPGTDMIKATEDVKNAVNESQNLPESIEEIKVKKRNWRDRVTNVIISGPVPLSQLSRFADEFVQELYRQGVAKTSISGISPKILRVQVPEEKLVKYDLSLRSIAEAIRAESESSPAGEVSGNSTRVRAGSSKRSKEEIESIVVRSSNDGSKIRVIDIGDVKMEGLARDVAYFKGENPAVFIRVDRGESGDAIDLQEIVEATAEKIEPSFPVGVTIELSGARAEAIKNRLNILLKNGLQGFALVLILLFLFLSARTAFWVALGIPAAMLFAIAMMYAVGLTLNMISLFALILCLGIVVDDAIVVGEHADFRARRLGEGPAEAAERSAIRMGLPVFTATITTVLAFAGLVAVGGRFGRIIADIPFTVIVVLLASLLECFFILPNHMRHALTAKLNKKSFYDWPSNRFNDGFRYFREKLFRPIIRVSIYLRYQVVAAAVALLAFSSVLLISGEVKWRFFNAPERGGLTGNIAMLPGAKRQDTLKMLDELERATYSVARKFKNEHGHEPLTFVLKKIGGNSGRAISGSEDKDRDLLGAISVELIDADLRNYSSFAFVGALQEEVRRHPLLETLSFRGWRAGPGDDGLAVDILGSDAKTLKEAAEYLITRLSGFPEISGLEDNQPYDKNELIIDLTPRGKALGFSIEAVGAELYQRLNGIEAASYLDGKRTSKIIVSLNQDDLNSDFIEKTHLRGPEGKFVKLSDIVAVKSTDGFSTIRRENGQRKIIVSGDIAEDDPSKATVISNEIENIILPELERSFGVTTQLSGLAKQEKEFLNDALIGFSLCFLGIYLALSWVFESWTRPIAILIIIPFGLIGTLWGHYWWDVPLSMFSIIGLIGMTGIIINDAIVLISTIDEYSSSGSVNKSIIGGTIDRLRAVLLTTLTTVLGLLPLLFETSKDAQFLKPTIITLVYGLGFGMFIVLLLVPAVLAIQSDLSKFFRSLRRLVFLKRSTIVGRLYIWTGLFTIFCTCAVGIWGHIFLDEVDKAKWLISANISFLSQFAIILLFVFLLFLIFAYVLLGRVFFAYKKNTAYSQPLNSSPLPSKNKVALNKFL